MVTEEEQSHMELASESVPVPQVIKSNEMRNNDGNNEVSTPKKKPRLRKKALHAAIRKQMEFYFGDANLSKDRFLGNYIKQDPYVELQVFLRFNKIRNLTTDINQIVKALQKSEMLSVSEDGSRVCRITPISHKENIDDCTIYVQRLPLNADHEWLSTVFNQYGKVSYVSIPRYKSNKRIKGFAFVEYEEPGSAVKCVEAFREKGCVLPSQTSPESLLSITTFHEEEMMEKLREKQANEESVSMDFDEKCKEGKIAKVEIEKGEICEAMETENEQGDLKTSQKRKHEDFAQPSDSSTQDVEIDGGSKAEKKSKKLKERMTEDGKTDEGSTNSKTEKLCIKDEKKASEESEQNDELKEVKSQSKKRKASEISEEEKSDSLNEVGSKHQQIEDGGDSEKEKKSSKRKQRIASTTKHKENPEFVEEDQESSKKNDKKIENEEDGNEVFKEGENPGEDDQKKKRKRKRHNRAEKLDTADIGMQIMAKRDWKTLRNKYLELQRSKMKSLKTHLKRARWNQWNNYEKFRDGDKSKTAKDEGKENSEDQKSAESTPRFIFTPGVIVRVEMDEPCTDPKNFKMELKRNSNIKYIDVSEGASEAFLRCDTNEAAKALVLQSNEERSMSILQDKEESEYWEKISKDREEKVGKKFRVKQRGRDKLLKKAEKELGKHIKFDEV